MHSSIHAPSFPDENWDKSSGIYIDSLPQKKIVRKDELSGTEAVGGQQEHIWFHIAQLQM